MVKKATSTMKKGKQGINRMESRMGNRRGGLNNNNS